MLTSVLWPLLLLLRIPENILELLELSIVMELSVLLGSALLHKVQGPVRSCWRGDLRMMVLLLLLVNSLQFLAHLVELEKLLRAALLSLQKLLRKLGGLAKKKKKKKKRYHKVSRSGKDGEE
jgi:hypothetical protein